jgi:lipoprotein NlpD
VITRDSEGFNRQTLEQVRFVPLLPEPAREQRCRRDRMQLSFASGARDDCSIPVRMHQRPVPVSERDVSDYRKPQPSASSSVRSSAPAAPVTAAPVESRPAPSKPATATVPTKPLSAGVSDAGEEGDWRPETYTVKRGDTLYSIALDHGLDYKELAAWNQLADVNVIKVGQQLKLRPPPGWKPEPADATDEVIARPLSQTPLGEPQPLEPPAVPKSSPKGVKVPYSDDALAQLTRAPTSLPGLEPKAAPLEPKPPNRAPVVVEQKPAEPKPIVLPEPIAKAAPAIKVEPVVAKPAPRPGDSRLRGADAMELARQRQTGARVQPGLQPEGRCDSRRAGTIHLRDPPVGKSFTVAADCVVTVS